MKKILTIVILFSSLSSFGQYVLRKDQLNAVNARDIKSTGAYSSLKLGKLIDSLILSLNSQRRAAGYLPVGNSSGIAVDVPLSGDGTLSSAGSLSVIKINGNTFPSLGGNAGKFLTNNGSSLSWGVSGGTVAHANNGSSLSGDTVQTGGAIRKNTIIGATSKYGVFLDSSGAIWGPKSVGIFTGDINTSYNSVFSTNYDGVSYTSDISSSSGIHSSDLQIIAGAGSTTSIKNNINGGSFSIYTGTGGVTVKRFEADSAGTIKILPNGTTGSSGQFLQTDGTGKVSWATSSGGVTSIATTSPITGGTITTTGTIACATCVTSAASLTSNALMIGGGSQTSSTTTTGTGVLTALGINVGSAGAFTTFNGAGGTPSSLTLTNATGLPPVTGISGWPANSSGSLTNNGSGTLSWTPAGTLISVGSADGSVTITNPTTTPDLSVVKLNQGTAYTEVGTLLDETFPGSSLNGTNWSGSLPTGASISSKLIIASGMNDWSRYIQLQKFYPFEKEDFEIYFKAVTKNSGDAWGITQNPTFLTLYNAPIYIKFDQSNGANSGQLSIGTTTAANEYGYSQPLTFSAGDQLKLTLQKKPGRTIAILENITSPTNLKAYGEFAVDIKATGGQYRLSFLGGQQEFSEFKVTSKCRNFGGTTGVVFLGDSHTGGASLPDITWRYSDILMKGQTHLFENLGTNSWLATTFTSGRVTEFLSGISAKYLVVNAGYNDAAQSESTSTYETALETIATTAQGLGYTVIFVSLVPSYTADNSAYNTQMSTAATNTSSQYISISSSLVVGTTLNPNYVWSDAVHMNPLGHQTMADAIKASAIKIFAPMLTDFNNADVHLYDLPFGKASVPLIGLDHTGRLYKVDPSKYINDSYPILQSTLYNTQTGSIGFNGKLLIGDVFQQKNATSQGLQIGFNNGINDAASSNINITNSGTHAGIATTQGFNNITGARNISIFGTTTKGGTYAADISGNDNTFIQALSLSAGISGSQNISIGSGSNGIALTSGNNNIGIGKDALKAITTGTNNLHLITRNTSGQSFAIGLSGTVILGEATTGQGSDAFVANDISLSTNNFASQNFWLGGRQMGNGTAYTFTFNAAASLGTNIAGNTLNFQASRGTGTAEPGAINFKFSTPVGTGTTLHSAYTTTLGLTRTSTTISQPALASGWTSNLILTPGAHTALTAATEFVSNDHQGATQTWVDGTTTTQRFNRFRAFTTNKTTTSAIFTDIYNSFFEKSIAGSGVTFTRNWGLGTDGNLQVQGSAYFGAATTAPTALISLAAGTTSIAPLNFTSGSLTTGGNIKAGNFEFLTDDYYATITTGTAVKKVVLADASGGLTSGKMSVATTNGRLLDANISYSSGNLSVDNGNLTLSTAGNKIFVTEGSNGSVGQTTLVSGTKAVTVTGTTTNSRCFAALVSQGGTVTTTIAYTCACTSNTVTITAVDATKSTVTTDTSIVNYWIVN